MKNLSRFLLLSCALSLSACGWLGEKEKTPLQGKREAVLQAPAADALQNATTGENATTAVLPEAVPNAVWGQSLAYPTHNPQHLSLAGGLTKRLWSESVGKGIEKNRPVMAAPIIAEGRVYALDTAGQVSAFDVKTGKRLWKSSTRAENQAKDDLSAGGGIAYGRNAILVTNGSRDLAALNAQNGNVVWRTSMSAPLRGAPALLAGRAYVTDVLNHAIAVDANSGEKLWSFDGTPADIALLGTPAPAVDAARAVAALSNGVVVSLDLADGTMVWDARFNNASVASANLTDLRDVAGVPVLDSGKAYAVNASGRVIALDALSGARQWQKDARATGPLWPAGDVVFLMTREGVAARAAADGAEVWEAPLPQFGDEGDKEDPIRWFGPYLLSGKLYTFGSAGKAVVFDPQTGQQLDVIAIDDNLAGPPAIASDMAAMVNASGKLSLWQ